jgi:tRNA 2-(methylsulfanyl)-N6-isopentenyladenosine37 hydroxylase
MLCLKVPTDGAWAVAALRDTDATLVDHAHCELKAASNALSLLGRHAHHTRDAGLIRALADVAREEVEHFQRVVELLSSRRVALGPPPVDAYAAAVRRAAGGLARGPAITAFVDRLLVAAIIEARSCERFQLLAETVEGGDPALHALWRELLASEARHYRTFVDLAVRAADGDRASVSQRLDQLAEAEGAIVVALAGGGDDSSRATMHG